MTYEEENNVRSNASIVHCGRDFIATYGDYAGRGFSAEDAIDSLIDGITRYQNEWGEVEYVR